MAIINNSSKVFTLALLTAAIAACGGGSGSSSTSTTSSSGSNNSSSSGSSNSSSSGNSSSTGSSNNSNSSSNTSTTANHALYATFACMNVSNCTSTSGLNAYSVNTSTGALTAVSTSNFATSSSNTGWDAESLKVNPTGKFAYLTVPNGSTGSIIYQYAVGSNGALTALATPTIYSNLQNTEIVFDPSGKFAIVQGYTDSTHATTAFSTYSIDSSTGALSLVQTSPAASGDLSVVTINPVSGMLYTVNQKSTGSTTPSTWSINQYSLSTSGTITQVGNFAISGQPVDLNGFTIDPTGKYLYVVYPDINNSSFISEYNIGTGGTLTQMSTPVVNLTGTVYGLPNVLAIDSTGKYAYAVSSTTPNASGQYTAGVVTSYSIGSNGVLSPITSTTQTISNTPSTVTTSGSFVYVGSGQNIYSYTIGTTGALTALNNQSVTSATSISLNLTSN